MSDGIFAPNICFVHNLKIVFHEVKAARFFSWKPVQVCRTNYFHAIEDLLQAFLLFLPSMKFAISNKGKKAYLKIRHMVFPPG